MVRNRSAKPLSTHDRKVREVARTLEKQGYEVRAHVRGRERPRPVGPKRLVPDVEATRNGARLIVEVETPASLAKDKEQLKSFARHARQEAGTTFRLVVTRPRSKRPS